MSGIRIGILTTAIAALMLVIGTSQASANTFLGGTITITHSPDTANTSLDNTTTTTTIPYSAAPGFQENHTYTVGASTSTGKGGASEYDTFAALGTNGYANAAFSYGSGVGQTDGSNAFGGSSTLTMNVDLMWDISNGWSGPRVVYQLMPIVLHTTAATDVASASGSLTYSIEHAPVIFSFATSDTVDTNIVDYTKTLNVSKSITGTAGQTLSTTLFTSGLLTTGPVTPQFDGEQLFFHITGSWTFTASDDESANVLVPDLRQFSSGNFADYLTGMFPGAIGIDPNQALIPGGGSFSTTIPEPASMSVLAIGLGGLMMRRRRRNA